MRSPADTTDVAVSLLEQGPLSLPAASSLEQGAAVAARRLLHCNNAPRVSVVIATRVTLLLYMTKNVTRVAPRALTRVTFVFSAAVAPHESAPDPDPVDSPTSPQMDVRTA